MPNSFETVVNSFPCICALLVLRKKAGCARDEGKMAPDRSTVAILGGGGWSWLKDKNVFVSCHTVN